MSGGRKPGPTGGNSGAALIDPGTSSRVASPLPGAVGLAPTPGGDPLPPAPVTPAVKTSVTAAALNAYLGKHITDICTNGYHDNGDNHCAHFVSHVLSLTFGTTCRMMGTRGNTGPKANLRVQEVFAQCGSVGEWDSRPDDVTSGLVFITKGKNVNVDTKVMANVPRKHVGIFIGDAIWHYSNSKRKVVTQTPEQFSKHYAAPYNAMFYGTFP